jgi:hypothetical protein
MVERKVLRLISAILPLLLSGFCWGASSSAPGPTPTSGNRIDLNGKWTYVRSAGSVNGMCPAGKAASGIIVISQAGMRVDLNIISGSVCDPGSLCHFSGNLEQGHLSVSNHAVVDDEGGKVTNVMNLGVISDTSIQGNSISNYKHPKGFACTWNSQVKLTRATENTEGTSTGDTGSGNAAGPGNAGDLSGNQNQSGNSGDSSSQTGDSSSSSTSDSGNAADSSANQNQQENSGDSSSQTGDSSSSSTSDSGNAADSSASQNQQENNGNSSTQTGDTGKSY